MAYRARFSPRPNLGVGDGDGGSAPRLRPAGASGDRLGTLLNAYAAANNPRQLSPYFGMEESIAEALQNQLQGPANTALDPDYQQLRQLDAQEDQFNRQLGAQERMGMAGLRSAERVAGTEARARAMPGLGDLLNAQRYRDEQSDAAFRGRLFGAGQGGGAPPAADPGPSAQANPFGSLYARRGAGEGPYDTLYGAPPAAPGPSRGAPSMPQAAPQAGPPGTSSPYQTLRDAAQGADPAVVGRVTKGLPQEYQVDPAAKATEKFSEGQQSKAGALDAEAGAKATERYTKAIGNLQQAKLLEGQLERAGTGYFEPWRMLGKQIAADLGFSGSALDNVKDFEAARSGIMNMMTTKIGADTGGVPANNFSEADRGAVLQMLPSLDNTPGGNQKILGLTKRLAELDIAQGQAWDAYKKENGRLARYDDFSQEWRTTMMQGDHFIDLYNPNGFAAAAQLLQKDSSPEKQALFDRAFYPGAAAKVLGGR